MLKKTIIPLKIKGCLSLPIFLLASNLFIVALASSAQAASESKPLLRSTEVSEIEAEGYAEAMQRQMISQSLDRPPEGATEKLGTLLQHAQESWISGSIESARENFSKMSEQALQEDWREPERETIVYAVLRLAQIAKNDLERDRLLRHAIVFSSDTHVDEELFPPPLLNRYQELKNTESEIAAKGSAQNRVRLRTLFKGASFVRLNGKKYSLDSDAELILQPGEYRISIFSDSSLPVSLQMSASEIANFKYTPTPLAFGTCEEPRLAATSTSVQVDVLFSKSCVRTWASNHWLSRDLQKNRSTRVDGEADGHQESATSVSGISGVIPTEWLPHPDESQGWPVQPSEKSVWGKKETWIWIGVTAIAAGTAYAIYQNQHPAKTRIEPNSSVIN